MTDFYWDEAKTFFFSEKKFQNGRFSKSPILKIFVKISWIGPWVSRINWCEEHWCSSFYMVMRLSDVRAKQPKNTKHPFFACFWAYIWQPHNHVGWATSMPLVSINPTNQRINPWNFHKTILRIGDFEKLSFFLVGHFPWSPWKSVTNYVVEWKGQNFDVFPCFQQIPCYA